MRGRRPGERRARLILVGILRTGEHVLAGVGGAFLVYRMCFTLSVMISGSMAPTLLGTTPRDGDRVLTEKVSYRFRSPRRWEVITFRNKDGVRVMKRVVGLPGERISLRDGVITADERDTQRPETLGYLRYYAFGSLRREHSVECGEGYFVLGDDSRDSQDSRFEGPVDPSRIEGRSWLVVWPASRWGVVNR